MKSNEVYQAVDDLKTIKSILKQTSRSFTSFSKIFLWWSVLFFVNSIVQIYLENNPIQPGAILNLLFPLPLILIIAIVIYYVIGGKIPLNGLEKRVMTIWVYLFGLTALISSLPQTTTIPPLGNGVNTTYVVVKMCIQLPPTATIFMCAFGLLIIPLFTDYKQPKWVAMGLTIYGVLSVVLNYFIHHQTIVGEILKSLEVLVLPATFLYLGLYLKSKGSGEQNGY